MAIEDKITLLRMVEQQLSSEISVSDMHKVLAAFSDQLASFDVENIELESQKNDDLFDAYVNAMRIQGRSEKTISRYSYLIKRMVDDIKVPTREITVYHLRRYLSIEKERGLSDRTLEGMRQVFSAYFNWLQREGLITTNPVANLGAIKYQKKIKEVYTDIDLERMKFGCKSLRDRAIVAFLNSTGCRISEMTQLNRSDIDINNLECTVNGKGNKQRTVYLDQVTGMLISEYLKTRKDILPALFVGKGTERISPQGVRSMLKNLSEYTLVKHVHPHKFRRTLATNLIRHGMPIQEVAAILGHDKLDTTMQYVVLDKNDIKHSYRKYA